MSVLQRIISITEVQDIVARAFHLSRAEMLSRSRRQHVVCARHVAMYLSRQLAGRANDAEGPPRVSASFPRIGKAFCRDHSSVIHACNAIGRRQRMDAGFAALLRNLAREVSSRADAGSWGVSNAVKSATNERPIFADQLTRITNAHGTAATHASKGSISAGA
jgi:hypothetical protein